MAQIQSPETYADGQQVTAARMNNMVNGATVLPGLITDQSVMVTTLEAAADLVLLYDDSSASLRKVPVADLFGTGSTVTAGIIQSDPTGAIPAGYDITIQANGTGNMLLAGSGSGTVVIDSNTSLRLDSSGAFIKLWETGHTAGAIDFTSYANPINFTGYVDFKNTTSLKLPTGTTGQRPATAYQGEIRYNSTTLGAEVYNGTTWEAVGGGPFDATGGNKIIAPDAVATSPISASFTSADGESVVVSSAGHAVTPGQVVRIATSVTGYSGDWTVISANTNDFTFAMTTTAAPNSGSCTYKKAGNYKVHIFTSSGSFVAGNKASSVEVLVVGGGGGGSTNNPGGGGGGGAVVYYPYYNVNASQTISVTIGAGGASNTNGSASVFGTITAGGGLAGSGVTGGASGTGSIGVTSKSGGAGSSSYAAGGGGGSSTVGNQGVNNSSVSAAGGDGGDGFGTSIQGIKSAYGGGGGGGSNASAFNVDGTGSNGGAQSAVSASANTGGGGGGRNWFSAATGSGGSGIVIVRYPSWV